MEKRIKSFISTFMYIFLGVFLAFAISQTLALALSTTMPVVAVESNSMVPTFQRGDILVLQGVEPGGLAVGDIIVFSPEGQDVPVVHRIIKINDDGTFQTKGDANPRQLSFETHIRPDQVRGKEILIIPYLGWIKIGITEYAMPNIIFLIVIVIVIWVVKSNVMDKGKKRYKY